MAMQKSISILTVPIFTRLMTTSEYGQYTVYLSWLNVTEIFASLRLYAGVYNKGMNKYNSDRDGYALSMQYTSTVSSIICYFIYLLFQNTINNFTGMNTFVTTIMFIQIMLSQPMLYWTVKERYSYKYKNVVFATLLLITLDPVLGILLVNNTINKGMGRILSLAVVQCCFGLVFYIINLKKGRYRFKTEYAKFAILFNIPLIPHYFSEYILNTSDRIMIQKICGYSDAALYSVAYSAGMILTVVSSSINQALVPWMYQCLDQKRYDDIKKHTLIFSFILFIPLLIFIALAPEIVKILAGPAYAKSIYVIPPVCSSVYFLFWYTLFANIEFYFSMNKFTMYISMIGAGLNIILNYIFIHMYGFTAAGYTTLFCYMIYSIGHYLYMSSIVNKMIGFQLFDSKKYFLIGISLLLFVIIMSFVYKCMIIRWFFVLLFLLVFYLKRDCVIGVFIELKNFK